ncbi:calcium-binding protein [Paracraurococcus lichenis]|uniref:Calcium-binding protein n=1 Tax=Paracraurococcus lichenis TaxID=3064888 RepID=A0ABT9DWQ9_9PROT|nr:calcium-binding protein [Paracraurococcus sp. LOR1-02]MDO9708337.1 calcium-binding protein [Paracraurococcus sp. LOR1-02]
MIVNGTSASETLNGTAQDDVLTGLGGNDALRGGDGNDVYVFSGAFGRDTIDDTSGTDQIQFGADYRPADFRLVHPNFSSDLVIQQVGGDNTVTLDNYFNASSFQRGLVETVLFTATGTLWNLADGSAFRAVGFTGTAAAETVNATPGDDLLIGLGGNDTLLGGDGNDVYYVSGAFGRDTIRDTSGRDTVVVGADWTDAFFSATRPNFSNDLVVQTANGQNALIFDNYFANAQKVETIYFQATGAAWDLSSGAVVQRPGLFDYSGYYSAYLEIKQAGLDGYNHYLTYGFREGRDPSAAFDTTLYLLQNPDVAKAGLNPLQHYLFYGQAEGRAAHPAVGFSIAQGFDAEYYLLSNPAVGQAGLDAFQHWSQYGWRAGANPNYLFDTKYYLAQNPVVAAAGIDPLLHYDQYGWKAGLDPSPAFHTSAYLAANPDVAAAGVNPLQQYLQYGVYEGRPLG